MKGQHESESRTISVDVVIVVVIVVVVVVVVRESWTRSREVAGRENTIITDKHP